MFITCSVIVGFLPGAIGCWVSAEFGTGEGGEVEEVEEGEVDGLH